MREPGFWHGPASLNSHLLKPLAALYGAVAAKRLQSDAELRPDGIGLFVVKLSPVIAVSRMSWSRSKSRAFSFSIRLTAALVECVPKP